jgi:hypothetical protein
MQVRALKQIETSMLTFIEDSFRTGKTTGSLDCVLPIELTPMYRRVDMVESKRAVVGN